MDHQFPKRVENYTTASLVLIFVNMLWIFGVIWVNFGLAAVILLGWALNHAITWLGTYRARREIQWPSDA